MTIWEAAIIGFCAGLFGGLVVFYLGQRLGGGME